MKPVFYTTFHLNLAFSSIEEEDRPVVIERCYWPLLELAEQGIPVGIEATSYTLKAIQDIDPSWIEVFKKLISSGKAEFVGSGFVQMIAPLVPPELTRWNLKLGLDDYEEILGIKPEIALVNEQAYSASILPLYYKAGFKAVMMDWAEPASHHPEWSSSIMYKPAKLMGQSGVELPVLWSDAISFQKFQRYVHGEIEADEYLEFINLQLAKGVEVFPLYTSDAEVFDYRPGRFEAEAKISGAVEHARIEMLCKTLVAQNALKMVLPSEALKKLPEGASNIQLETAEVPVPVKKQRKYNITRWGVTGRADLQLNTHCWRVFNDMGNTPKEWRMLCSLWASDYRTHITEKRWSKLLKQLPKISYEPDKYKREDAPADYSVHQDRRFLAVEAHGVHLVLNLYRGMAIHAFGFGNYTGTEGGAPKSKSLIGTLAHGYYDDIAFGADFYSGHLVYEPGDSHKITDLNQITPKIYGMNDCLMVEADISTRWGILRKRVIFDAVAAKIDVAYEADWLNSVEASSMRLGYITLIPEAFDIDSLYYSFASGGNEREKFSVSFPIEQGKSVSRLVSSTSALGLTDGILEIGDDTYAILLESKREKMATLGMLHTHKVADDYFVRAFLSAQENDETSAKLAGDIAAYTAPVDYCYSISLKKHSKPL